MRLHPADTASLPNRTAAWLALWLFALGTSVTLVAGWGRSVAWDQATLTSATEEALTSEIVSARLTQWLADGIAAAHDLSSSEARAVVDDLWSQPDVRLAMSAAITEVATAAVAEPERSSAIDLRDEFAVAKPSLVETLARHGIPVDTADVIVDQIAPIVAAGVDAGPVAGTVNRAKELATSALIFGIAVMVVAGLSALNLTDNRVLMVRTLASRVATSAITFGVMLQLSAWALDPSGGATPLRASSAVVLRSNLHVPIVAALGSLFLASIVSVKMRSRLDETPPAPSVMHEAVADRPAQLVSVD